MDHKQENNNYPLILKGTVIWSDANRRYQIVPGGYLIGVAGICQGVFETLPDEYKGIPVQDYQDQLIIPGMTDLHVHAPQYGSRGFGMDLELLEWLNTYTFPEEAKYKELEYAQKGYSVFVNDLVQSPTTRACIFATIHKEATLLLMDLLEESGLVTYTGKVNMDRNSPDFLCEKDVQTALEETIQWIVESRNRYQNTMPILTPRFVPSCSDELMRGIRDIMEEYKLPVQSHLSENRNEIAWVHELCPNTACYGEAYDQFDLFGSKDPAIMAHCVHSGLRERKLMKERGTYIAHCPQSNLNLASGIAPVRTYLEENQKIGLGTDVAGGANLSLFRAATDAIQMSKMYYCYVDSKKAPLTMEEAFYLATRGGGSFFGRVGYFEKGCELDALVLSEQEIPTPKVLSVEERLERIFYLAEKTAVAHKFVRGKQLY